MSLNDKEKIINQEIYYTLFNNSLIFFNKSIDLILKHKNGSSVGREDAIFLCLYTQFTIELAIKASIVHSCGIEEILDIRRHKNDDLQDIYNKFQNNIIHTKKFEELKLYILRNKEAFKFKEFDFNYVNNFQRLRNKIVHINYNFSEIELETLIYSIIYVLTRFVVRLLGSSYNNISLFLSDHIKQGKFLELVKYKPYIEELKKITIKNKNSLMLCPCCDEELYDYRERECLLCLTNIDEQIIDSIDCYYCHSECSVVFDKLNIGNNANFTIGICRICGEQVDIYECPICGNIDDFNFTNKNYKCSPDLCGFYQISASAGENNNTVK